MKLSIFAAATALVIVAGCGSNNSSYKPVPEKPKAVAAVKPGEEASLFPVAVGNKWQYTITTQTQTVRGAAPTVTVDIALEVKAVTKRPDGSTVATIEVSKGDVAQDSQTWIISPKGVFQETIGMAPDTKRFDPDVPVAYFPIEVDKEIIWDGKGPTSITQSDPKDKTKKITPILPIHQVLTCRGVEDVDTFMGMMSAYRFESIQTYSQEQENPSTHQKGTVSVEDKSYTWLAPKIGMVRYVKELTAPNIAVQKQTIMLRQYTVN